VLFSCYTKELQNYLLESGGRKEGMKAGLSGRNKGRANVDAINQRGWILFHCDNTRIRMSLPINLLKVCSGSLHFSRVTLNEITSVWFRSSLSWCKLRVVVTSLSTVLPDPSTWVARTLTQNNVSKESSISMREKQCWRWITTQWHRWWISIGRGRTFNFTRKTFRLKCFISYLLRFSDRIDRMKNSYGNFFIQS